jgi:hypothetical protein
MEEDGKFRVDKLNSQNYHLWKMQMEDYLYQKDLVLPLDGIEKKLTIMKDEEWTVQHSYRLNENCDIKTRTLAQKTHFVS